MLPRSATLLGLGSFTGTILAVAIEIALLVVALTVVRTHRPDAVMPLATSAGLSLASTLASAAFNLAMPFAVRSGGMNETMSVYAMVSFGLALVRALAGALLIFGIVRLARPEARRDGP